MNVAFITVVNLDDLFNLPDVAAEIAEQLNGSFEVISVAPWARPTLPTTVPTQTTQTNEQTNI